VETIFQIPVIRRKKKEGVYFEKKGVIWIEEKNFETALEVFKKEFETPNLLWLDEDGIVFEIRCEHLHLNSRGKFICGPQMEDGKGLFGYCILEGVESHRDCPVKKRISQVRKLKREELPLEKIKIKENGKERIFNILKLY